MASYDARHAMYMSGTLILHIKSEVLVMIWHDTLHILKYLGVIDGEKDWYIECCMHYLLIFSAERWSMDVLIYFLLLILDTIAGGSQPEENTSVGGVGWW